MLSEHCLLNGIIFFLELDIDGVSLVCKIDNRTLNVIYLDEDGIYRYEGCPEKYFNVDEKGRIKPTGKRSKPKGFIVPSETDVCVGLVQNRKSIFVCGINNGRINEYICVLCMDNGKISLSVPFSLSSRYFKAFFTYNHGMTKTWICNLR